MVEHLSAVSWRVGYLGLFACLQVMTCPCSSTVAVPYLIWPRKFCLTRSLVGSHWLQMSCLGAEEIRFFDKMKNEVDEKNFFHTRRFGDELLKGVLT